MTELILAPHPIQPLYVDGDGVVRFKANRIVQWMLDMGRQGVRFDLNVIAATPFSTDDREQLAQLIGYSLSGFGELSYVRDATYEAAEAMKPQP